MSRLSLSKPALCIACLAGNAILLALPASASTYSPRQELDRIAENVQDLVTTLAIKDSLNGEELDNVRRELALVYRDLDALSKRLESGEAGQPGDSATWQPYPYATREVWPEGKQWKSWHGFADVSFKLGQAGAIILSIDNFDYEAKWTIQNAYSGDVTARVNSTADGDVVLTVTDSDGQHEFLVQQGGLGELYIRGRKDYVPPVMKSASEKQ